MYDTLQNPRNLAHSGSRRLFSCAAPLLYSANMEPALIRELDQARRQTDDLFRIVRPDSLYERPIPERHRLIFYLGHLEAFDWNLLGVFQLALPSFHASFDRLFAFGIDPKVGSMPDDRPSDWPGRDEVERYNRRVRGMLDGVLGEIPTQLIHVAIEHRLMHAETFAYLLHNLPLERKIPVHAPMDDAGAPARQTAIKIPAGTATLGCPRDGGFGWDNEFDEHTVEVPAFAISKYKVTNGEYLEFVHAAATFPHFWVRRNGQWFYRSMFGEIPLPLDWPVYVTHEQAAAYAAWAGKALPGEAQFHRAAFGTPEGRERAYPWGDRSPAPEHGNFDFRQWDPVPVTHHPAGDSAFGVSQLAGNGWEWTSTLFEPFPGFREFPFYPGYSRPFFDGDHFVMKGGSPRTARQLLRRSFRNWFRPRYPYTYAGFRWVEN